MLVALRNTSKPMQSSRSKHEAKEAHTMQQKPTPSSRSPHQAVEAHTKHQKPKRSSGSPNEAHEDTKTTESKMTHTDEVDEDRDR